MQLIKTKKVLKESKPVIYEVNLTIDNDVIDEFDEWLQKHIDDMLAIPGFVSASTAVIENNDENTKQRSVQFRLTDQEALDSYFEQDAERMRALVLEEFNSKIQAQRRVLTPSQAALAEEAACANCGTQLEGRFCSSCGQREEPRVPTFMALSKEVTNALFGLESKIWRSIAVLLFMPGQLTQSYLSGKRQRYTSPFRIYLLFSIATFACIALLGTKGLITINDNTPDTPVEVELNEQSKKIVADLEASGLSEAVINNIKDLISEDEVSTESQDTITFSSGVLPSEMEKQVDENLTAAVANIKKDIRKGNTEAVVNHFIQPLPKALLLFLPFIALAFKVLFIGNGKYYIEHLIYLLHNHAFLFALLMTTMFITNLAEWYKFLETPIAIAISLIFIYFSANFFIAKIKKYYPEKKVRALLHSVLLTSIVYAIYALTKAHGLGACIILFWLFYAPYYMYRSMRVVYQRSRWVSLLYYAIVSMVYFIMFVLMLTLTAVFSGMTYG